MSKGLPEACDGENDIVVRKICERVPGYKGYCSARKRRQSDSAQREVLATRLVDLKEPLDVLARELTNRQRIDMVAEVDRVTKRIEDHVGRLRFACDKYRSFFRAADVAPASVEKLYAVDLGLHRRVDSLTRAVTMLAALANDMSDVRCRCRRAAVRLDQIEHGLDQREMILGALA